MLTSLALAVTTAFAGPSASTPAEPITSEPVLAGPVLAGPVLAGPRTKEPVTIGPVANPRGPNLFGATVFGASMGFEASATAPGSAPPTNGGSPDTLPDAAALVSFETKDGQLLQGSFYAPKAKRKSSKGAAPAALLLHDAGHTRGKLEELAAYLHKKGFAVLTVDLRGHGASETAELSFEKADDKEKQTLWSLSARDVDAAADYLLGQHGVHASNLSIFSVGASASLAVRRATDDDNVRAVVLMDPSPDAFGYNLANGVGDLGGLPTYILAPKDKKDTAKELQEAAHAANDGLAFVDVSFLKSKGEDAFGDKKLKQSAANWLREQVMPKK